MFLFDLGCNVEGNSGNGTSQGTCPKENQVCKLDGTCHGKHYYPKY